MGAAAEVLVLVSGVAAIVTVTVVLTLQIVRAAGDTETRRMWMEQMQAMSATNERVLTQAMALAQSIVEPKPDKPVEGGEYASMFSAYPEEPEDPEEDKDWSEDYYPSEGDGVSLRAVDQPMPSTGRSVVEILGRQIGLEGPEAAG